MQEPKRAVEVVVLSDIHLGTYGCHAEELLSYLKSIWPKTLVLNGDIIDMWQFSKRYWPKSHMKVIKHLTSLITKEVEVIYIPGNHDEMLRKFVGFQLGSFRIANKAVLEIDGKKAWCFHSDVFDVSMQHAKWLARLGAEGYDLLILLNRLVNYCAKLLRRPPISMSKKIKGSVKSAIKFIHNFEKTASDIAISNDYEYVVCGHIHQPDLKRIETEAGTTTYLNSGDWVENLTALEYNKGSWKIYKYEEDLRTPAATTLSDQELELVEMNKNQLFALMQQELNQLPL